MSRSALRENSQSIYKIQRSLTFGTHAVTDTQTDGQPENIMPPTPNGGRGIK